MQSSNPLFQVVDTFVSDFETLEQLARQTQELELHSNFLIVALVIYMLQFVV